ncbi:uncharacterized protein LOC141675075 isoform X2 [Apium graveolens]|uniref:uncharacterized protein LOC141675075 isoform X2 n=1 Tax=Apium graveolens TaxID=4045 RepID=UPI003D79A82B
MESQGSKCVRGHNIEFFLNPSHASDYRDPVDSNYQSNGSKRLTTRPLLLSNLNDVQVDTNFQASFEKIASNQCGLNAVPKPKPLLRQPDQNCQVRVRGKNYSSKDHKVFRNTLPDDTSLSETILHTPGKNASPSDGSQTSGTT